jgi:hypothetical protein
MDEDIRLSHIMKRYITWRSLIGWLPLIWLGFFAVTIHGACAYFVWQQCIGRYAPFGANLYFSFSKIIGIALLILIGLAGIKVKYTVVGWIGWIVSIPPILYHFLIFID